MDDDKKLLLSKCADLFRLCQRHAEARFSDFLDGGELAYVKDNADFPPGFNTMLFGGFPDAERRMLGVFPEWEDPSRDAFPISALKVTAKFGAPLEHRGCLGVLMSQGIDRCKTGDIIIADSNTAYIFVCADIAPYLADNIVKIGNQGVKCELCSMDSVNIPEPKLETINTVSASLRLDACVAALCGVSRSAAAGMIGAGKVKINHREEDSGSYNLKENDLISVRGFGRFRFFSSGASTRKGRIHITAGKYV